MNNSNKVGHNTVLKEVYKKMDELSQLVEKLVDEITVKTPTSEDLDRLMGVPTSSAETKEQLDIHSPEFLRET